MLFSLLIATALVTNAFGVSAPRCPEGWQLFQGGRSCVKAFTSTKSYYAARHTCQENGGDLVIVDSSAKNDFVRSLVGGNVNIWIGVYDKQHNKGWTYVDGSAQTFKNWAGREPNNWRGQEACGHIWVNHNGKWNDINCVNKYKFVCELSLNAEPKPKPNKCPADSKYFQEFDSCLKAFPDKKSYYGARQTCQENGGDLVIVDSMAKNYYVRSLFSGDINIWIGDFDKKHSKDWTYVDGSPETFKNWANREPNNWHGEEACGHIWVKHNGKWNDINCANKFQYVCEFSANGELKPKVKCPADSKYFQEFDSCLKAFTDKKSFSDARKTCQENGGDLVIVDSLAKNYYVRSLFSGFMHIWIGLYDEKPYGNWKNVDESPLSFKNWWRKDQPDNWKGTEHCGHIRGTKAGKWNDINCANKFVFVCQEKPIRCPEDWQFFQDGRSCVKAFPGKKSYYAARHTCQENGGDLVIVDSSAKNDFVRSLFSGDNNIWIGDFDKKHSKEWTYVDGSPETFKNWADREPNNWRGQEACGHIWVNHNGKWNDINCANKYKFVCELSVNAEPKPKSRPNSCPADSKYFQEFDSCLKAYPGKKSYYGARQTCQENGGDLVIIDSMAKNYYVRSLFSDDINIWIGEIDKKHSKEWTYVDGSPETFTNWANREPNNWHGEEACGHIWVKHYGKWNDINCANEYQFVCEFSANGEPKSKPKNCKGGWKYFQEFDSCLKAFPKKKSYSDARKTCKTAGGDLVIVDSMAKNYYVRSLFNGDSKIWFGVYDKQHNGKWTYVDGSALGFKNWAKGEPNNLHEEEACGHLFVSKKGKWNDSNCANQFSFVCQRSANGG